MIETNAFIGGDPNCGRSSYSRAPRSPALRPAAELVGLDDWTTSFIRWKAHQLGGRGVLAAYDTQDLMQEISLECWRKSSRYDTTRSTRRTFFRRISNNRIANLIEEQTAKCRDFRLCQRSLNDPTASAGNGAQEFGESISDRDYETRMGRSSLSTYERTELQIDVSRVISGLPAELSAVAVQLQSVRVVEAARRLNVSRSTLCRRIERIRDAFVAAGFGKPARRPQQRCAQG